MFHSLAKRLFISLCKPLKYKNLAKQDQHMSLIFNTLRKMKLISEKKNDFFPHKCVKKDTNQFKASLIKEQNPVLSNVHIWLFL